MKYYICLLFCVSMVCSCQNDGKLKDVYDPKGYSRISSAEDSVKNMYVLYRSNIDTSFSLFKFYWDNGRVQGISYFRSNIKTGPWTRFFDDGKISFEGSYEMGKKTGEHKVYFPNGKISSEEHYKDDRKTGVSYYYKDDGSLLNTDTSKQN